MTLSCFLPTALIFFPLSCWWWGGGGRGGGEPKEFSLWLHVGHRWGVIYRNTGTSPVLATLEKMSPSLMSPNYLQMLKGMQPSQQHVEWPNITETMCRISVMTMPWPESSVPQHVTMSRIIPTRSVMFSEPQSARWALSSHVFSLLWPLRALKLLLPTTKTSFSDNNWL